MTVSALAGALGVRPSTPRHWDAEGLVVPRRSPSGRARTYSPSDVRDARIVHQLRQARRWEEVTATLAARETGLTARSRALLQGAVALDAVSSASPPRLYR